jgi:2-polyprenyl-6-methoxyphenol hydroxylase-like FAD-dependent oxidoreductase
MSGLLAARVLSDTFSSVTVVDRDVLPESSEPRRGVPQGSHAHLMLARCAQILAELFPGILDELAAAGVPASGNDFAEIDLTISGHRLVRNGRIRNPMPAYFPSRPLLEDHVRRRLRAVANIIILDGHDVRELVACSNGDGIAGARVVNSDSGEDITLNADLVVDATGRGSRTPFFLEALGYQRPPEDELVVRLAYSSQVLHIPPGILKSDFISVFPAPGRPTSFGLFRNENDRWMLTLGALAGHEPPTRRTEMFQFLESIAPPYVTSAVRAAQPLGAVTQYRVPSNRWRRYDKMERFPERLLVVGDANCSFNPIYGQGMTIAAIEATVLQDCLRRGAADLARRYFKAAATHITVAWQTAVASDLSLPEIEGPRSLSTRITNALLGRILTAAETDTIVAEQFIRVTGMLDPAIRLFHPAVLLRVATAHALRRDVPGK